jgi:probable rRNA maturation factor
MASLLESVPLDEVTVSIALVRDPAIRRLNAHWRAKQQATDVLSFPAGDSPQPGQRCLGDLVISIDTAKRQAKAYGAPLAEELRRYVAHGLLHLLGHDHQRSGEARRMEAEERRLLGTSGMLTGSPELASPRHRRVSQ